MKSYFLNKVTKGSKGLLYVLKGMVNDLLITFQSNGAKIQLLRKENGPSSCCCLHFSHYLRKGNPFNTGCYHSACTIPGDST